MEQVSDVVTWLPSANVTTMLVSKMTISWYFSTSFAAIKLWLAPLSTKYIILAIRTTSPLHNSVVSLVLALMRAVHERPKKRNFFCAQVQLLDLFYRYKQQSNDWQRIRQVTLIQILTQSFGSQFFLFFRSGITPTCGRLTLKQRFPYILGTTSGFNPTQRKKGQVHTLLKI